MRRLVCAILILAWAHVASAQWIEAPKPLRQFGPGTLGDIGSRGQNPSLYAESDPVTSAHELTHGLNSDMRQSYPGCNCFYVLHGYAAVLAEPGVSLNDVALAIPHEHRGRGYKDYLIDSQKDRGWVVFMGERMRCVGHTEPLYVFDELSAYLNGARVAVELNLSSRFRESFSSALEFAWYAHYLLGILPKDYDAKPFRAVLAYQIKRCKALQDIGIQRGWLH